MIRKMIFCAKRGTVPSLILMMLLPASAGFAGQYEWKVHFPRGLSGKKCHIFPRAGGDSGAVVMNEGDTWSWRSGSPLTWITGWCEDYPGSTTSAAHLLNHTCAGTDYRNSVAYVTCTQNVSVKICMKENGEAGFCPN